MKLFLFSLKNAIRSWWRTLILGLFIFFIGLMVTFMGSFSLTIRNQMEDAIINGLSGHIQIRSASAEDDDFAEHMKSRWKGASFLDADLQKRIQAVLKTHSGSLAAGACVRHGALFISDTDKAPCLIIGLDPRSTYYQNAFVLTQGRMLDAEQTHEIVITENLAENLKVKTGSVLGVLSQTSDQYPVDLAVTVVGIVKYRMLSLFGFSGVYTDIDTARELIGFYNNEVSDIIIYLHDKNMTEGMYNTLLEEFGDAGITTESIDLQPVSGQKIKLSTYKSMGNFFISTIGAMIAVFYLLIILLLLIVSILIFNLVYMMGIERYKEIGTLRALGFSKFTAMRIFMTEIFCVTGFFGGLGILLGTALNLYFSIQGMPSPAPAMDFIMGKRLVFQIDYSQIVLTMGLLFGFSFIASCIPAYKACSLRPVETLKET
ncbi:MAG: ABC transporter permease [Spirochaetales bacterium]|nr:ABC transporter permease [Spirochaetales bacterium]